MSWGFWAPFLLYFPCFLWTLGGLSVNRMLASSSARDNVHERCFVFYREHKGQVSPGLLSTQDAQKYQCSTLVQGLRTAAFGKGRFLSCLPLKALQRADLTLLEQRAVFNAQDFDHSLGLDFRSLPAHPHHSKSLRWNSPSAASWLCFLPPH